MGIMYQGSPGATFGAAGANHSQGMVVDPGTIADTASTHRFLRSDATWVQVDYSSVTSTPSIPSLAGVPQLLNTLTANNSATLSDTSTFTNASYSVFDLVFENVTPASISTTLQLQVHSGGAFKNSGYLGATTSTTSGASGVANATTFIQCSRAATVQTSTGVCGNIRAFQPGSGKVTIFNGRFGHPDGAVYADVSTTGAWNTASVVDGFQILFNTGNITSGIVKIYGIP